VIRFYNYNFTEFFRYKKYLKKLYKALKKIFAKRLKKKKRLKKFKWLHGPVNGRKLDKFKIKNKNIRYMRKKHYLIKNINNFKAYHIEIVDFKKKINIL
jgi:hypothetical protein